MTQFNSLEEISELWTKEKKEVILYEDTVYDVKDFKSEHPGGVVILEEQLGKRIDEPFAEENHSAYAKKVLKRLPVVGYYSELLAEKLEIEVDEEYKKSFFCSRKYVIKKLVTKEDPIYLHKILGIYSLASYILRYAYYLPKQGNLGFEGSYFDTFSICMHIGLAVSSMIFEVLRHRILKRPLVIWKEYRLHAIVFTLRCTSVYFFALFWQYKGYEMHTDFTHLCLAPLVLFHHYLADEITRRWGPVNPNETTVRGVSEQNGNSSNMKTVPKVVIRWYAFFQICALGSSLSANDRLMDLGFNPMIGVQLNAFLMTLFRKGLIRWYTHAFWYTVALILAWCTFCAHLPTYWFLFKMSICFYARTSGVGKYYIWIPYSIFNLPSVEKAFFQMMSSIGSHPTLGGLNQVGDKNTWSIGFLCIFLAIGLKNMNTVKAPKAAEAKEKDTAKPVAESKTTKTE